MEETGWRKFLETGSVWDYLSYKNCQEAERTRTDAMQNRNVAQKYDTMQKYDTVQKYDVAQKYDTVQKYDAVQKCDAQSMAVNDYEGGRSGKSDYSDGHGADVYTDRRI
jgi:hypothetical protein